MDYVIRLTNATGSVGGQNRTLNIGHVNFSKLTSEKELRKISIIVFKKEEIRDIMGIYTIYMGYECVNNDRVCE